MENEIYLKLSKDEIETIKYALNFQNDVYSSNSLNYDGSENDDLIKLAAIPLHKRSAGGGPAAKSYCSAMYFLTMEALLSPTVHKQ